MKKPIIWSERGLHSRMTEWDEKGRKTKKKRLIHSNPRNEFLLSFFIPYFFALPLLSPSLIRSFWISKLRIPIAPRRRYFIETSFKIKFSSIIRDAASFAAGNHEWKSSLPFPLCLPSLSAWLINQRKLTQENFHFKKDWTWALPKVSFFQETRSIHFLLILCISFPASFGKLHLQHFPEERGECEHIWASFQLRDEVVDEGNG